jgi:hypothetical protein
VKTLFIMLTPSGTLVKGVSESMDTLPTVYENVEVYAVRVSEAVIEEVRELMSREHTAEKVLPLLKRSSHSFTFCGNL